MLMNIIYYLLFIHHLNGIRDRMVKYQIAFFSREHSRVNIRYRGLDCTFHLFSRPLSPSHTFPFDNFSPADTGEHRVAMDVR